MNNITPTTPSFAFGYWRPWKENSNLFDSFLDYAKDVSLIKYGADTVGTYINQASKEQIQAINELGQAIGRGMNILSNQMADINQSLGFINRNMDIQIEQQKLSNLLLHNIAELLRVPDSEKERQHSIELGIKFFVNAAIDSDLFADSLEELLKAESLMKQDYFVLHRIGCIFLYAEKFIDPEKALEYFLRAAKYASVESDSSAIRLASVLTQNFKTVNSDIDNSENQIGFLASDSYEKAAFTAYVLGRFEDAVNYQNKALKFNTTSENRFMLSKYQVRNNNINEAIDNLDKSIEEAPYMAIAAFKEIDLINEPKVIKLIASKNDAIDNKIESLMKKWETISSNKSIEVINNLKTLSKKSYEIKIAGFKEFEIKINKFNSQNTVLNATIDSYINEVEQSIYITYDKGKIQTIIKDLILIKDLPLEKKQADFEALKNVLNTDKLQIGKKYAGGIVFHLDNTGKHGLVCSEVDFGEAAWGGYGILDSDKKTYIPFETSSKLGEGMENTELIVKHANFEIVHGLFSSKKESILTAAELCLKSNHNGHNDWFLPNSSEMRAIIKNLIEKPVNDNFIIRPAYYWSSCGLIHTGQAFAFDMSKPFGYKHAESRGKGCIYWVRGVRKF
jgi:hypothetical protein